MISTILIHIAQVVCTVLYLKSEIAKTSSVQITVSINEDTTSKAISSLILFLYDECAKILLFMINGLARADDDRQLVVQQDGVADDNADDR
jgi:hypothetical protein